MNIASAFLKQCIDLHDFETWNYLRKEYLPKEYHALYEHIQKHTENYSELPTFEHLKLGVRQATTRDKIFAIEKVSVEVDPTTLLEYLKNEYTQREILNSLDKYVDNSVLFSTAEESVEQLHQIVLDMEEKVDLRPPQESMQNVELFEREEELSRFIGLGLNSEYDERVKFSPRDLVLIGGKRGAGKSTACANIATSVYESGKSAIYFTIEMDTKSILQRCASIATGISHAKIHQRNLTVPEWERIAKWWAGRFVDGDKELEQYALDRDFDALHLRLKRNYQLTPKHQLDVVYDPSLNLAKIRAELDMKVKQLDTAVIIVDYINQVKRSATPPRNGQYDWTEQIEVSKALKSMAQEYECPVISPYQIDASGEARFAKGILDAADAAFTLDTHEKEDECISFNCVKMRSNQELSFTSYMDWDTLKIGPQTSLTPTERDEEYAEM